MGNQTGGGNHVSVWDALVFGFFEQKMGHACLKFGEVQTLPLSENSDLLWVGGRMVIPGVPNSGRERFRPRACLLRQPLCMNVFRMQLRGI